MPLTVPPTTASTELKGTPFGPVPVICPAAAAAPPKMPDRKRIIEPSPAA